MAEVFIGLSVLATLRDPHNAKVRGLVTNAVAGEMTLNKGKAPHSTIQALNAS